MVEAMMTVQAMGAVVVPARPVAYTRQLDGLCIVLLRPCLSLFSRPTMMLTHAVITATPPPRLSDDNYHRHCPHSMRSRLYVTVRRPSVRPSVCLSHRSTAAAACGEFAAERPAGRTYRSTAAGAGAPQQTAP